MATIDVVVDKAAKIKRLNKPVTYPVLAGVLMSSAMLGNWALATHATAGHDRHDRQTLQLVSKEAFDAHVAAENVMDKLLTSSVLRQEQKVDFLLQQTGVGLPTGVPTAVQALDGGTVLPH